MSNKKKRTATDRERRRTDREAKMTLYEFICSKRSQGIEQRALEAEYISYCVISKLRRDEENWSTLTRGFDSLERLLSRCYGLLLFISVCCLVLLLLVVGKWYLT